MRVSRYSLVLTIPAETDRQCLINRFGPEGYSKILCHLISMLQSGSDYYKLNQRLDFTFNSGNFPRLRCLASVDTNKISINRIICYSDKNHRSSP